jgi:hypothetical protein
MAITAKEQPMGMNPRARGMLRRIPRRKDLDKVAPPLEVYALHYHKKARKTRKSLFSVVFHKKVKN